MVLTPENFRQEASKFLVDALSANENVLIDAPPGLGKTRAGAKAAIALAEEKDHRVLLLEPTKTLRGQMVDYLHDEKVKSEPHESRAYQDYHCPIIEAMADPSLCTTRKEICRAEGRGCGVLKDIDKIKESRITVATFPKFLLSKSSFAPYNTFIIDESHGFENAETTYLQSYVQIAALENVAQRMRTDYPDVAEKLVNLATGLTRYREIVGDSSPLAVDEINTVREALSDDRLKEAHLECSRKVTHPEFRYLYNTLSTIHYRAQNISDSVFFFYEGSFYARPKNMANEVANFFMQRNVALLSATVDNATVHARSCGVDLRRFPEKNSQIMEAYPEVRRNKRLLLCLTDSPNLSKNEMTYDDARKLSNEIILRTVRRFKLRTLVLFRSYSDHKSASAYLAAAGLGNRIISIEQAEDPDTIDKKITDFKSKSGIVLTTASSRLWEGVDIPGLRLVMIDALPYPGKDPVHAEYNFAAGHNIMIKKLKQGLGRIIRSDEDWGAAVVIDSRFVSRFTRLRRQLPWHMGDDFRAVTTQEALDLLDQFGEAHRGGTNEDPSS